MKHHFSLARHNYTLPDSRMLTYLRTTVTYAILLDAWRAVAKNDVHKYLARWYRGVLGIDEKELSMYMRRIALGVMLWNMHDRHGHNGLQYALDHVGQQVAADSAFVARLKREVREEGFDAAAFNQFLESIKASLKSAKLAESTPVTATPSPTVESNNTTPTARTPLPTPTTASPQEEEEEVPEQEEEEVPEDKKEEEVPEQEKEEEVPEQEEEKDEQEEDFGDLVPGFGSPDTTSPGGQLTTDLAPATEEVGVETKLGHDVADHVDQEYCDIRDHIVQFMKQLGALVPELRKFATSSNWSRYTDQYVREIQRYLELRPENTPECKRIVETVSDNLRLLVELVQQAYVNMMRFEAQNTINVLNPDEFRDFMLSLAIAALPKTVPEAERLSRLRPV